MPASAAHRLQHRHCWAYIEGAPSSFLGEHISMTQATDASSARGMPLRTPIPLCLEHIARASSPQCCCLLDMLTLQASSIHSCLRSTHVTALAPQLVC